MAQEVIEVVEVEPSEAQVVAAVRWVLEEEMGAWQAHYAMACFERGVCRSVVALSTRPVGTSLFYSVRLEPGYSLGVIYYVAVARGYRRRKIGSVLVLSAEHVLEEEGADVVVATTRADNHASRRLFAGLGYREIPLDSIEEAHGELFTKLTCSYEDDLALVKGLRLDLEALVPSLKLESNARTINRLWYSICYKPWREAARRFL